MRARTSPQDARALEVLPRDTTSGASAQWRAATCGYTGPEAWINEKLRTCPACGKQAGELVEEKAARFPFRVQCRACGSSTDSVKLEAVAVKLWNEAKREGKAKARRK
jgi:hypothetical protein